MADDTTPLSSAASPSSPMASAKSAVITSSSEVTFATQTPEHRDRGRHNSDDQKKTTYNNAIDASSTAIREDNEEANHELLVRPVMTDDGGGFLELKMEVGDDEEFELEKAVCNHGFFMTAPNNWIPSSKTFQRPLRLPSHSVLVSISQPAAATDDEQPSNHLLLRLHSVHFLSPSDHHLILKQVARMLRISIKDEYDMTMFHELHAKAKKSRFGRLFRSPDLFEDIVKSILLCNTSWPRTLQMCQALCELLADEHSGNFPSSKELANLDEKFLKDHCRLGYRAKTIIEVARLVENGKLKLNEFEGHRVVDTNSYKILMKIKGVGSFTMANILMCIGIYHKIPIDTETIEHIVKVHRKKHFKSRTTMDKIINQFYEKFAPYQCLAYWYERVAYYEKKVGERLSKLSPSSYYTVTSPRKKKW